MKPVMLSGCRAAAWPAMPSDGHWLADPREHLRQERGGCRYICLVPFALRRLWALNLFEKNKKQTEARKRDFFFPHSPQLKSGNRDCSAQVFLLSYVTQALCGPVWAPI